MARAAHVAPIRRRHPDAASRPCPGAARFPAARATSPARRAGASRRRTQPRSPRVVKEHRMTRLRSIFRARPPGCRGPADRGRRAGRRRRVRAAHRAGDQADRRRDGAHARLQRLDPRPDAAGSARARRSIVNVVNEGDLEATVHWHGLRLDNRYDGTHETQRADPGRRQLHRTADVPGSRRVLVPPAHPPGLRPGDGPVRQHPGRPGRPGLLAAGPPRARRSPSTTCCIEDGQIAPFSRDRDDATRRWAASATCCSSPANPTSR